MTNPSPTPSVATGMMSGLRTVGLLTLASRVLGLVRDVAMGALFGNGVVLDAFTVAFRVPNLARRIFGEGALTAAFLPAFVGELETAGRAHAWKLASSVLALLTVVLSLLVLLVEAALFAAWLWGDFGADTKFLLGLTALLLPYVIFICLASQVNAVLHALSYFTVPALSPVILNLVWIVALCFIPSQFESQQGRMYAVAAAVTFAGVVQLAASAAALHRLGYRFELSWLTTRDKVSRLAIAVLPIVIGLSVTQLNTLCDGLIAWGFASTEQGPARMNLPGSPAFPMEAGTASALYFGQRLYQFPLGVFGVALGTVLFPMFSRHAGRGDFHSLRNDLSLALRLVTIVGLPASLGLVLLARPLASLLFQYGSFDAHDAAQTSEMIAGYGVGVFAFCGLLIVNRAYYAIGDQRTPLRIGLWIVGLNFILNLVLIWPLGGIGLALSTSVCAILQVAASIWFVQEHIGRLDWSSLRMFLAKAVAATAVLCAVCMLSRIRLDASASVMDRFLSVLVPLSLSTLAYLLMAKLLGLRELWLLFQRDPPSESPPPPDENFS